MKRFVNRTFPHNQRSSVWKASMAESSTLRLLNYIEIRCRQSIFQLYVHVCLLQMRKYSNFQVFDMLYHSQ